ncbi:MAG: response regulator [Deltaproteobacteria bacterium]|nr:response regulator [Deltaproteobacteria bacterium]
MNKILMIDDDYVIRLIYKEELSDAGYQVITANDCEGLMEMIERHRPDLIILSITMQNHSGFDALQNIRHHYYDLPVILCTGYPAFKFDPRAIAADYVVVRSGDLGELKLKIEMAIESTVQFQDYPISHQTNEDGSIFDNMDCTHSPGYWAVSENRL